MSKIEKALRKAERDSKLPVQQPATLPDQGGSAHTAERSVAKSVLSPDSANTIALMRQPEILSPHERALRKIILREAVETPTVKALREIRTKILQRTSGKNVVIMVTAIAPGNGATFSAVNLAAAFALDASKTSLLIDCNIHRPFVHNLIVGGMASGLTNYLTGDQPDLAQVIHPTGVERMRAIPVGTKVSLGNEYFTMERMQQLIWSVRERYADRQIFLDCPPLSRSVDTQILLGLCDYLVLVVPYAGASLTQLKTALALVEPRKLLGVVINDEPGVPAIDWATIWARIVDRCRAVGRKNRKVSG